MIRGSFKGIQEFLRICNALTEDRESALVEVNSNGERGEVVFVKGNLHAARLGRREGVLALQAMLKSEDITFLVREVPESLPARNVFVSLATVMENMGFQDPFLSMNPPSIDEDLPPGVEGDIHIPESAEEMLDDPKVQRAIRIFHDLGGVEGVIYAHQGRVRAVRGFGERDAHISRSAEELREIRSRSQRWVDRIMLMFNASGGIYRNGAPPRKILLAFPEQNRWLWARLDGDDLYVVWLDTSKLTFGMETEVLDRMEQMIRGA